MPVPSEWASEDILGRVDGSSEDFPPLRVLFVAHRYKAQGCLTVELPGQPAQRVFLKAGKVIHIEGISGLLSALGIDSSPSDSLGSLLGRAIGAGTPPDRAMEVAGEGLGDALAAWAECPGAAVHFDTGAAPPGQAMPLPSRIPLIIARALAGFREPEQVQESYGSHTDRRLLPLMAPREAAGLGIDPLALRLLREAGEGSPVWKLTSPGPGQDATALWCAVDYLVRVGLARLEGASGASEATDKQELGSDEEQPESSGRSEAEEAEAIEMLREAKSELQKARSAVDVLGFTSAEDCTPRGIDRVFVELSTRFHPDRYVGFSAEVRELAQVCFSAIVTAVEEVREPVGYEDAVARLKARERGEHYVTATDQRHARLAFTQSEMLFKNRKWSEAWEPLQLAVDLDPANWRYQLLYQQCAYHVGESTAQQAREALLALNPPAGAARADSLHAVGEILLADGQEEEAYRLYHKALKEHPDHIGAKRRLWLRHKRSQRADANEKSVEPSRSKGVLSGLFGRKK